MARTHKKRKKIPARSGAGPLPRPAGNASRKALAGDLQLHMIELEMQNRELLEIHGALEAACNRYSDLFDFSPVSYVCADEKGLIQEINLTAAAMLGMERADLIGKPFTAFIPEDRVPFRNHLKQCRAAGEKVTAEITIKTREGRLLEVELHSVMVRDVERDLVYYRTAILDIGDRKKAEKIIRYQAFHDALTGLPNRALFDDRLKMEIAHASRELCGLGVLFLDLDNFKKINDTFGHGMGDRVIQEAGQRLLKSVRDGDTVCRIGGDEFILLLHRLLRPEEAERVAQKILDLFREPFRVEDNEFYVHVSVGVSLYPQNGADGDTLMKNADEALYHAKEKGKNNYQVFSPAMGATPLEKIAMENSLQQAVRKNEFVLNYQPQVDRKGKICGMEALLRWDSPGRGRVYPDSIIPLAERAGLMVKLGEWVLREACRHVRQWMEMGLSVPCVSVNLSATQFHQSRLPEFIAKILLEEGVEARNLELEITESSAMRDLPHTLQAMRKLKSMGLRLALDDFGTGHSSLNYLRSFPLDTLKIDQAFVRGLLINGHDLAIVRAILLVAKSMRLRVVAEGVETNEQFQCLQREGCHGIQGYLFSKAVPSEKMAEFLKPDSKILSPSLA